MQCARAVSAAQEELAPVRRSMGRVLTCHRSDYRAHGIRQRIALLSVAVLTVVMPRLRCYHLSVSLLLLISDQFSS